MKSPCWDCDRREQGCHSKCEDYKGWRLEQDKIMAERQKEKQATPALTKKVVKQIWRGMKGK